MTIVLTLYTVPQLLPGPGAVKIMSDTLYGVTLCSTHRQDDKIQGTTQAIRLILLFKFNI